MFRCNNCKIDYYYPMKICSSCSKETVEMTPKKFKVTESIEVRIPSLNNMQIPYFVNILVDEFGVEHFKKTFEKLQPGDDI
jgi:hypothetical protein